MAVAAVVVVVVGSSFIFPFSYSINTLLTPPLKHLPTPFPTPFPTPPSTTHQTSEDLQLLVRLLSIGVDAWKMINDRNFTEPKLVNHLFRLSSSFLFSSFFSSFFILIFFFSSSFSFLFLIFFFHFFLIFSIFLLSSQFPPPYPSRSYFAYSLMFFSIFLFQHPLQLCILCSCPVFATFLWSLNRFKHKMFLLLSKDVFHQILLTICRHCTSPRQRP